MFVSISMLFALNPSGINEKTTLYLMFPFIGPMFYCIPGFSFTLINSAFEIIYVAVFFSSGRHTANFSINIVNSIVCSFAAIMCGNVVMSIKVKSLYQAYKNLRTEELESLNSSLTEQYNIINSISFMFFAVYYVDLVKDTVSKIVNVDELSPVLDGYNKPKEMLGVICDSYIEPEYADLLHKFSDAEYIQKELSDKDSVSFEFLGMRRGWGRIVCISVERVSGKVTKVLWCFENINEHKEREFSEQEKLKEAVKAARKADLAKSSFLFNMSHDIRTPMNAILGYAALLDKSSDMEESLRKYVSGILSSGKQLLGLINSVLETARIESGKIEINEDIIYALKVKDTILDIFRPLADNKNLELDVNINVEHEYIYADPVKTNEIIMNIVSNAVKYTDKGSVNVTMTERPGKNDEYGCFVLSVKDTGIGISEDFLPHIFESFTREKNATESSIIGTGLGLDITKKLIELMDGKIEVKSELGKGSEFICSVPFRIASKEAYLEKHNHDQSDEYNLKGKRILLTEDNELNADIALEILSDYGAEIEWAKNGQMCIDMLKEHGKNYYDVILMDVQMPVMDGLEATKEIRKLEDESLSKISIIAMTANAFEEDRKSCINAGMNGFVSKPIKIDFLMKALEESWGNR